MEITSEKVGDVYAVQLAGRLDAQSAKTVEERLLSVIDQGELSLVLDLSRLDYISSIGLRVFMLAAKRLKRAEGRMAICSLQPTVQQIFEIAGFTTIFAIFPTLSEAIAGASSQPGHAR